ncbi:BQ2448_7388 [Microbotryum intermedium]|uniref:BQ2448_7388 protein n=1 Tax=Microbotryum intermedium TaxID=269621 RepID=A0A238FI41_9BASI|nr:BQ2448_7388 [Microbotryum intermedium]
MAASLHPPHATTSASSSSPSSPRALAATRLDTSSTHFKSLVELSSIALGATIESFSDDFFAEVHNMIKLGPPVDMPGQFGPNGSLMDGWERAIVKLGAAGAIHGFDIDTRHFAGNECPATDVWGATVEPDQTIKNESDQWQQILPLTPLGPAQQHFLLLPRPLGPFTHLKVTQHPDGGIGRFRAYGHIAPSSVDSSSNSKRIDLASILQGGRVTSTSDEHYSVGSYLLLPGRGKDMEDGWHTRRSRGRLDTDQGDWLVVELGQGGGFLEWCDIDTKDFKGNFPDQVALYGCEATAASSGTERPKIPPIEDAMRGWTCLLDRQNVGAHAHHVRELKEKGKTWAHVCLRIYPDGGLKRLRLFGRPSDGSVDYATLTPMEKPVFDDE